MLFFGCIDSWEVADVASSQSLEAERRWRLALGETDDPDDIPLEPQQKEVDKLLSRLYESGNKGSLHKTSTISAKWFSQIKDHFPGSVLRVVQRDAIDRFGIKKLLSQPAILDEVEPDLSTVATLLSIKDALSPQALATARQLVGKLTRSLEEKLKFKLINRLTGRTSPKESIRNPKPRDIDWDLTIRKNLKHYQPQLKTIIPQTLIGRPRSHQALKRIILLIDQSASMTESFIYAAVMGSVMASIRSLKTHLIVFDTDVVDLTDHLQDPVDILFNGQLGGGTNIQKALSYAKQLCDDDIDTHLILISDLFEGGPNELMQQQVGQLMLQQIKMISLLSMDDHGTPVYDKENASFFSHLGIPCFTCSPDRFPEMMACALNGESLDRFQS